ncbi:GNAT family N-acetyltransferase, partial [Candidatus Dojkabacteria bacterium]|nr:GNAT family N-acetyltransferase [Candidatus Dojkabacteria bacterium]
MNPTFSLATKHDLPTLSNLLGEMFNSSSYQYKDAIEGFLKTNSKYYYIVKIENEIIGMTIIHYWKPTPKPGKLDRTYWHLSNLYIKPEYRGQNIGSDFLNYIYVEAKKQNVEKILTFAGG